MNVETVNRPPAQRGGTLRRWLVVSTLAFLAGLAAMGWGLSQWDGARAWLFGAPEPEALPAVALDQPVGQGAAPLAAPLLPQPLTALGDIDRLAAAEARIARLEATRSEAGSTAGRAEALLITFAARRAIERGAPLGPVETLLNQNFAASQTNAVRTVIDAAQKPVTLDQLQARLAELTPQLLGSSRDASWWQSLRDGTLSLFVIRPANVPSPDPAQRLARVRQMLDAGRVDGALAEVAALPAAGAARGWIADARRYVAANQALDVLESAAITGRIEAVEAPAAPVLVLE